MDNDLFVLGRGAGLNFSEILNTAIAALLGVPYDEKDLLRVIALELLLGAGSWHQMMPALLCLYRILNQICYQIKIYIVIFKSLLSQAQIVSIRNRADS